MRLLPVHPPERHFVYQCVHRKAETSMGEHVSRHNASEPDSVELDGTQGDYIFIKV